MVTVGELFKIYSVMNCFLSGYFVTLCECLKCVLHYFFNKFLVSLKSIYVKQIISNICAKIWKQILNNTFSDQYFWDKSERSSSALHTRVKLSCWLEVRYNERTRKATFFFFLKVDCSKKSLQFMFFDWGVHYGINVVFIYSHPLILRLLAENGTSSYVEYEGMPEALKGTGRADILSRALDHKIHPLKLQKNKNILCLIHLVHFLPPPPSFCIAANMSS